MILSRSLPFLVLAAGKLTSPALATSVTRNPYARKMSTAPPASSQGIDLVSSLPAPRFNFKLNFISSLI
jgi:hypothetical protein